VEKLLVEFAQLKPKQAVVEQLLDRQSASLILARTGFAFVDDNSIADSALH
jgi:hypothetical protein